jgi:hypothetical protein
MRRVRRSLPYGLALAVLCICLGCATTASYEQQMRAREEKAAYDQLPFSQKVTDYLANCAVFMLYGLGSSGSSFKP